MLDWVGLAIFIEIGDRGNMWGVVWGKLFFSKFKF